MQVELTSEGPRRATVGRRIPTEDGLRVELTLPEGRLWALTDLPGPGPGDTVSVRLRGGVSFPNGETEA